MLKTYIKSFSAILIFVAVIILIIIAHDTSVPVERIRYSTNFSRDMSTTSTNTFISLSAGTSSYYYESTAASHTDTTTATKPAYYTVTAPLTHQKPRGRNSSTNTTKPALTVSNKRMIANHSKLRSNYRSTAKPPGAVSQRSRGENRSTTPKPAIAEDHSRHMLTRSKNRSTITEVSQNKHMLKDRSPLTSQKSRDKKTSTSHNYSPICDRLYNISNSHFLDVVPRRAYYDNRRLTPGKSRNKMIVITEMRDSRIVEKSILACELNSIYSNVSIEHEDTCRWVRQNLHGYTHCTVYIRCIGFPESVIRSGSSVHIIYKGGNDSCFSRVATEKPLTFMKTTGLTAGENTIVVCSAFFGSPPFFNEWLIYQKVFGVDKVHLGVEKSFADHAITSYPFLKQSLDSGFVHMEVWENFIGNKIFYYSQMTKLQDCIMQYTGVYEFALVYDSDDFFVPMLPDEKNIHYYTKRLFALPYVGSVRLLWRRYVCEPNASTYNNIEDGNVTQSISNLSGSWYKEYKAKTMHRLYSAEYIGVHTDFTMLPKYKFIYGDKEEVYVAHIRPDEDKCHHSFQNSSLEAS